MEPEQRPLRTSETSIHTSNQINKESLWGTKRLPTANLGQIKEKDHVGNLKWKAQLMRSAFMMMQLNHVHRKDWETKGQILR